jgi:uncharacterized membrane protein YtjA (UPF0391 family)
VQERQNELLRWAVGFLVVGIFAAFLGFSGLAGAGEDIARFLFFLFLAIFILLCLVAFFVGGRA